MNHPTDALVERVARVLAPLLEGGREFDQMPQDRRALKVWRSAGMCSTNDATQEDARDAARAALSAMPHPAEPVAWMLTHPNELYPEFTSKDAERLTVADKAAGWTETPLYKAPPPPGAEPAVYRPSGWQGDMNPPKAGPDRARTALENQR